jgi:hypothetical protein
LGESPPSYVSTVSKRKIEKAPKLVLSNTTSSLYHKVEIKAETAQKNTRKIVYLPWILKAQIKA